MKTITALSSSHQRVVKFGFVKFVIKVNNSFVAILDQCFVTKRLNSMLISKYNPQICVSLCVHFHNVCAKVSDNWYLISYFDCI